MITNVMDLDSDDADEEFNISTRGSPDFVLTVQTMTKIEIKFKMLHDPDGDHGPGWGILADAKEAKTGVLMRVMNKDQSINGARGIEATMAVMTMTKSQPLAGAQVDDVVLKPTFGTVPDYIEI